jgi:hypothetical protein
VEIYLALKDSLGSETLEEIANQLADLTDEQKVFFLQESTTMVSSDNFCLIFF